MFVAGILAAYRLRRLALATPCPDEETTMIPKRQLVRGFCTLAVGKRRLTTIAGVGVALIGIVVVRQPPLAAHSADPTFAEDVAPIFYKNCTSCHHSGGMAPFSLVDYDSARQDGRDLRRGVRGRYAAMARGGPARRLPQRPAALRRRPPDDPSLGPSRGKGG
jgi:hypothetical protein